MATITKENIGLLHEKLSVTIEKNDYLPSFDKALKTYSKQANIPGFRKGMVPAGLIKKMYGASLFTDEVLKTIDKELNAYLQSGQVEIFAQPLPLEADFKNIDVNNPQDYTFNFEIGVKPEFTLPDLGTANITGYKVTVTDAMLNEEVERLQNRFADTKEETAVTGEDNVLTLAFTESDEKGNTIEGGVTSNQVYVTKYFNDATRAALQGKAVNDTVTIQLKSAFEDKELASVLEDLKINEQEGAADKYFTLTINKIGSKVKKELNQDFFDQLYPNQEVTTEEDLRNKIKAEIEAYWKSQSSNQIQDQIFHQLTDHTTIEFPETFLKRWLQQQGTEEGAAPKTDEQVEQEFPGFLKQLKWSLISEKITKDQAIDVKPEEVRQFALNQLFSYMSGMGGGMNLEDQPWVKEYVDKMMKDRKYVEDAFMRLQTQKMFDWAETQVKPVEQEISVDDFTKMVQEHQHAHH